MSTKTTIRWGIVGCGDVCEIKSGPGFQKATGSQLTAVMRRNGKLAEDFARRHNVPKWYDDADALMNDPNVDAIYIATPPGSHETYAMKSLAVGKAAYIEKPMARNHSECVRMVNAFAAAKLPLFVAYYRRRLPRFLKAKELVESGRLGKITGVGYRYAGPILAGPDLPWRVNAEDSGGGQFLDLGCHTLDILDFILGPLTDVAGTAANIASDFKVEDAVAMTFRTPSGALGAATWNFAAGYREDRIEIVGTDARVSLSTFSNEPVQVQRGEQHETFDLPNPVHIQQPMIQSIVDELLGKGRCPSTGETGARTSAVIDKVLESFYGSRGDGFWKEPGKWPGRRNYPLSLSIIH